jgi:hypothetical protein
MKPMLAFAFAIFLMCVAAYAVAAHSGWILILVLAGAILLHVVYPFGEYCKDVERLME